jgi:hypothetical protein
MSNHPYNFVPNAPVGSKGLNLPLQIPGFTNINPIKELIHFPYLHPEADITAVHFNRRKPKGFSNGHYLQFNPQAFAHNRTFARRYFTFYLGGFFAFNGLFAMQQYRRGKWFFGERYVPPFFNDKYLERIGRPRPNA